jgi:vancomycin resistance protein VanJ
MMDDKIRFSVMTCNIGNGRANPDRLVRVCRASGADLIGMQEVSRDQANLLINQLTDEYPHQALFPGGFAGKAVFSHYPISCTEQLQLSPVRPDLQVRIKIDAQSLTLIVAHPPPPRLYWTGIRFDPQTWRQIQTLAQLAIDHSPAILMGDFNLVDWRDEYAYLHAIGLQDAFKESGRKFGYTLPMRIGPWKRLKTVNRMINWLPLIPILRVDYVWFTEEMSSLDAWVGEDTGSDHRPVMAHLQMG